VKAPLLALSMACAALAACSRTQAPAPAAPPTSAPTAAAVIAATARATLAGASGSSVQGDLQLTVASDGVVIAGEIAGLAPNTEHGFHVHETGDCTAPDAKSAGGHFNPGHVDHGGPTATHHLGDIPNIRSDASGHAIVSATIAGATLRDGGANDLVGKAVIVHAKPDDYKTQPSGDSGDRIACGVVQ
jgi:superoxide dismutase, Cu-Zn family